MRIAVLGATGQTGVAFCCQALANQHQVVALVRNPDKMNGLMAQSQNNLEVILVDLFSPSSLSPHLSGADAVVSCVGSKFVLPWQQESSFYCDSMVSIVTAMREARVRRLVCISAALLRSDNVQQIDLKDPSTMFRKVVRSVAVSHMKDMENMENFLIQSCSDIDFTIMRPYALISKPMSSREVAIETNVDQLKNSAFHIYRENLAQQMLNATEQNLWVRDCVCIAMRS